MSLSFYVCCCLKLRQLDNEDMQLQVFLSLVILFAGAAFAAENEFNFIFAGMIPEATPAPATNCPTCGPSAADEDAAFCQRIIANEATFNTLLYFDNGEGAPIPPDQVNWSEVDALLAPTGFTQYDVSGFPFHGTFTTIRAYWEAQFAFPRVALLGGFEHWEICKDQVSVELWTEIWGDADNNSNNITVTSWYTFEWDDNAKLVNAYYANSATTADWSLTVYPPAPPP